MQILIALNWLMAAVLVVRAIDAWRGMASIEDITQDCEALASASGADEITVVVPARNEEAAIEASLRSLLASTGVRLRIIAVNDRSTDATGACMDRVAAETQVCGGPHSLSVIHVQKLPAGWLGKPHAMAMAARQATSPWILFTDGDVLFDKRALALALRAAKRLDADHLVLIPSLILETTGEAAMLAAMNFMGQWMVRLWKVQDGRARDFIGVGGFNLVRREVYERLGGFEALKMEILDDVRFGWLVKRAGLKQRVVVGPGLVRIRWLQGAWGVVRLAEKNGFAAFRFRTGQALLACLGTAALALLPLAAMAAGGWALAATLLSYAAIAITYWANRKVTQTPAWLAVLFAPATLVLLYALLRSTVLALVRKGVDWRGTRYSLAELRRNAGRGW
jgi:cellulose synthase/poly-beta-1,6-N-acetylglucosamine synthase-like glycosyltransferase